MKIVVCVKTPSGGAVDAQDAFGRAARTLPATLQPFDAHAVEEALRLRERHGERLGQVEIVIAAVGPAEGLGGIKEALALGADRAVLLADPALAGADLLATSRALAALLRHETADLYLHCPWSGDIDGSLLWAIAGERLGLPVLGQLRRLDIADGHASGERQAEAGDHALSAAMPCMVELSETINKPRYVTMKGRQAARAKQVRLVTLAELAVDAAQVGAAGAGTRVDSVRDAPRLRDPVLIEAGPDAAGQIVAFLESKALLA